MVFVEKVDSIKLDSFTFPAKFPLFLDKQTQKNPKNKKYFT